MILLIRRILPPKGCGIRLKLYGSLAESGDKLSQLADKLNPTPKGNSIHKKDKEADNSQDRELINVEYTTLGSGVAETATSQQCVPYGYEHSRQSANIANYEPYNGTNEELISFFRDSLTSKTKNHTQISFLADALKATLPHLSFPDLYRLTNTMLRSKHEGTPSEYKLSSLFQSTLTRINFLITEKLSYARGIVRVSTLPKYHRESSEQSLEAPGGIDLQSGEHVDMLWDLWLQLSRHCQPESKYTISLLLALLELESGRIFQFDLGRVARTLDMLIGESDSFSKLDERFILRLLKRFTTLLSSPSIQEHPDAYIKTNNLTPILVKKILCNMAKVSKTSPKVLTEALRQGSGFIALKNFVQLARIVVGNEHNKFECTSGYPQRNSLGLPEHVSDSLTDVHSRFNRLGLKLLVNSIDILRFVDFVRLKSLGRDEAAESKECHIDDLRNELIRLSHDMLSKLTHSSTESLLQECRAIYYLLLSYYLHSDNTVYNSRSLDLVQTVFEKITSSIQLIISSSSGNKVGVDSHQPATNALKTVQYLLYCDKISSFLNEAGIEPQSATKVSSACETLANELSKNPETLMPSGAHYGLSTLYFTLMNKYGLLREDAFLRFLGTLGNWHLWRRKELSMLCDLISRICENRLLNSDGTNLASNSWQSEATETMNAISLVLDSLVNYLFLQENLNRLGNNEFASLLGCMSALDNTLASCGNLSGTWEGSTTQSGPYGEKRALSELVDAEIRRRLESFKFNHVLKLLSRAESLLDEEIRNELIARVPQIEHLGDVSGLLELGCPELTNTVLRNFTVEVVEARYLQFERLLKNKFLRRLGRLDLQGTYTTQDRREALERPRRP